MFYEKNIDKFVKCGDINRYTTRSANNIFVPPHRLEQVNKGPFITAIEIYNHLPQAIKKN